MTETFAEKVKEEYTALSIRDWNSLLYNLDSVYKELKEARTALHNVSGERYALMHKLALAEIRIKELLTEP